MNPYCATCYKPAPSKKCGKCHRRYCSRECQTQDWQMGHKKLCGKGGQWGHDYEVKLSPDKQGYGVFALRDFKKRESIFFERPINPINPNQYAAALLKEMDYSTPAIEVGVHPTLYRANHECIGNTAPMGEGGRWWPGKAVELKAKRDIYAGEEITYSYLGIDCLHVDSGRGLLCDLTIENRKAMMKKYGFECRCNVCMDPAMKAKLDELIDLSEKVFTYETPSAGVKIAKKMIAIATDLNYSPWLVDGAMGHALVRTLIEAGRQDEVEKTIAWSIESTSSWFDDPDDLYRKLATILAVDPKRAYIQFVQQIML